MDVHEAPLGTAQWQGVLLGRLEGIRWYRKVETLLGTGHVLATVQEQTVSWNSARGRGGEQWDGHDAFVGGGHWLEVLL